MVFSFFKKFSKSNKTDSELFLLHLRKSIILLNDSIDELSKASEFQRKDLIKNYSIDESESENSMEDSSTTLLVPIPGNDEKNTIQIEVGQILESLKSSSQLMGNLFWNCNELDKIKLFKELDNLDR